MVGVRTSDTTAKQGADTHATTTKRSRRVWAAHLLTELFQPPVVVSLALLLSPAAEPGFPGTLGYGAVAAFFVCGIPLGILLVLVRLGRVRDHHVSDRKQRLPVLLIAIASVAVGLVVLNAADAPTSVTSAAAVVVAGVLAVALISPFWKISGHAACITFSVLAMIILFGPWWVPLLILIPAVAWSRLVLAAHTLGQLIAGTFLGALMAGLWLLLLGRIV